MFVFTRDPKSPLHQAFLLLTLGAFWWAFSLFMFRYSSTYSEAYFWMRMSAFWTFVPALSLNFIWIFRRSAAQRGSIWIYPFIYIPAIIFCILELVTDVINVRPVSEYWGYSFGLSENLWIYYIELAWAFSLIIISLLVCLHYYLSTRDIRKKKQSQFILIGFACPAIAVFMYLIILPVFGIAVLPVISIAFPEIVIIFVLIFSIFVGYAIWKYDLFVLTPATAADTIISTMTDLLIMLDGEENIVVVNRATREMLGYTEDELIGSPVSILIGDHPEKPDFLADIINNGGSLSDIEMVCRKKDGTAMPVSVSGSVISDNARSISGVVIVLRDITERKQAENALILVLEKLKKINLLSSITRHDILNQLTVLKGYLELAETLEHDQDIVMYLKEMQEITDVIDEQISFMKDYEEMGVREPVWHDVAAGIRRSIASLPMRNVRTVIDMHGVEVFADPLFEKVFYNLIDNALRYGGENLTIIRFMATESGAGILLVCEDDGSGISPDDKKNLFMKGFGKHTGLGLFLVREILSITGITITENGGSGQGARFEIIVPQEAYRFPDMH
ncbi:PAS domain S-box protein [Methanosphaerula palustris]|uniref:PAS domain S-box protein n=1 Tax=Methanosphaerula palustris TaxID=475088 RepID=UPI001F21B8C1|nr:PAS domain S-box protein [Methanosphaerula palustris]